MHTYSCEHRPGDQILKVCSCWVWNHWRLAWTFVIQVVVLHRTDLQAHVVFYFACCRWWYMGCTVYNLLVLIQCCISELCPHRYVHFRWLFLLALGDPIGCIHNRVIHFLLGGHWGHFFIPPSLLQRVLLQISHEPGWGLLGSHLGGWKGISTHPFTNSVVSNISQGLATRMQPTAAPLCQAVSADCLEFLPM
jgi:hypothetical protein